jgi:trimethylamine--corrinoid protein Co-methyltransferase
MHCSVAKFVVDAEQCAMAYRMAEGIRNGTISTRRWRRGRCRAGRALPGPPAHAGELPAAFFMPELFDNNSIEQWIADGSKEITARALDYARKLLADYEEPKLDEAKDEALRDYIARREREIPAVEALNQDY